MKRLNRLIALAGFSLSVALCLSSCEDKEKKQMEADQEWLRSENEYLQQNYNDLQNFLNVVAASLDTIAWHQQGLLVSPGGEGSSTQMATKEQIMQHIKDFDELLNRQRDRIASLEANLQQQKDQNTESAKTMQAIIDALKKQVEEKDAMIAELNAKLEQKDVDIADLQESVEHLTTEKTALEGELTEKTDQINEAYWIAGSKKELKNLGVLTSGGLLKKKKLDASNFDTSIFTKVDIRELKQLKLDDKSPKILTQMPEGSYEIKDNGDKTSTLVITDAEKFWSITNYLVIQY